MKAARTSVAQRPASLRSSRLISLRSSAAPSSALKSSISRVNFGVKALKTTLIATKSNNVNFSISKSLNSNYKYNHTHYYNNIFHGVSSSAFSSSKFFANQILVPTRGFHSTGSSRGMLDSILGGFTSAAKKVFGKKEKPAETTPATTTTPTAQPTSTVTAQTTETPQAVADAEAAASETDVKIAEKLLKGEGFNFDDFKTQLSRMEKLSKVSKFLPGKLKIPADMQMDAAKETKEFMDIIEAMTEEERKNPDLIIGSTGVKRRQRVADQSKKTVADVNRLLKRFAATREMMLFMKDKAVSGQGIPDIKNEADMMAFLKKNPSLVAKVKKFM